MKAASPFLFFIMLVCSSKSLFGQTSIFPGFLLEKMLDSTIVVVQSDYILRDKSGQDYARENRYYSRIYSLGLFSDSTLFLPPPSFMPWDFDPSKRQADFNGKTPILSSVLVLNAALGVQEDIIFDDWDTTYFSCNLNPRLSRVAKGLPLHNLDPASTEFLTVLITYNKVDAKMKMEYKWIEKSPLFDQPPFYELENIIQAKDFIGGIALLPVVTSGTISFKALGLIYSINYGIQKKLLMKTIQKPKMLIKLDNQPSQHKK